MRVSVCFNRTPPVLTRGNALDRIAEEGSALEAQAVAEALGSRGHQCTIVPMGSDILAFGRELKSSAPDIVFNLCEGFWGESGREMHVAALFELMGFAHTGSPALTLGLSQHKGLTKDILARHGLPTPAWLLVEPGDELPSDINIPFPCFVKPVREDASHGVSAANRVFSRAELVVQIARIHAEYRQGALVEEFIEGRELNAAVFRSEPHLLLPTSEICFAEGLPANIVSYAGKWVEGSTEYQGTTGRCPAPLSEEEDEAVRSVALKAAEILGLRDYGRIDMRLRDGIPYILELNANPDISPDAGFARSARTAGIDYPDLIEQIALMAADRREHRHA